MASRPDSSSADACRALLGSAAEAAWATHRGNSTSRSHSESVNAALSVTPALRLRTAARLLARVADGVIDGGSRAGDGPNPFVLESCGWPRPRFDIGAYVARTRRWR